MTEKTTVHHAGHLKQQTHKAVAYTYKTTKNVCRIVGIIFLTFFWYAQ